MSLPEAMIRNQQLGFLSSMYGSLGMVYGSLIISPIFTFKSIFSQKLFHHQSEDVILLGGFSLIFWTLTILALFKNAILVLNTNDNGQGGTFALYSLLCRHAKLGLFPNFQTADLELSTYYKTGSSNSNRTPPPSNPRRHFLKHKKSRTVLLLLVLFGACMTIAFGVLTPSLSVLSCLEGLHAALHHKHDGVLVLYASALIVVIFVLQHIGTKKLGFVYSPVIIMWLLFSTGVGVYNIVHWNPKVFRAFSPHYIYTFFNHTRKDGWLSLAGVLLCITGTDAMFSELGHFSASSMRATFICLVYPALTLQYLGQVAYLSRNISSSPRNFYESVPEVLLWPAFLISTCAAVVASEAVISTAFSTVSQCHSLGCFPRVKVVAVTRWIEGHIYIPEMNWALMIFCLLLTVGSRQALLVANACGATLVTSSFVMTCLVTLTVLTLREKQGAAAVTVMAVAGAVELSCLAPSYVRAFRGGWIPLALSSAYVAVMYAWHYGTRKKYLHDVHGKVPARTVQSLGPTLGVVRSPGIGIIYTELVIGVPSILTHFLANLSAFHDVGVFVSVKFVPVTHVPPAERYLVARVGPSSSYGLYRCVVRYGYTDVHAERDGFESELVASVVGFVLRTDGPDSVEASRLDAARLAGVTYVIGHSRIKAKRNSSLLKKLAVDLLFSFLRKNCRSPAVALHIPGTSLIEVGLNYYI